MFAIIESICPGLDVLVNNAGISFVGLLQDMSDAQWSEILNTNLSSVFYCCRSAIGHMVSQKSGKIINISSMWRLFAQHLGRRAGSGLHHRSEIRHDHHRRFVSGLVPRRAAGGFAGRQHRPGCEEVFILAVHFFLFNARRPSIAICPGHLLRLQVQHDAFILPGLQIRGGEYGEIPASPTRLSVRSRIDVILLGLMGIKDFRVGMETRQYGIVG